MTCAALVALCVWALLAPGPARAADSVFSVKGRGWGHGIGMTQYGAMGFAQQGRTYDWILAHYFQNTDLATRPELTVKVDLDAGKAARSTWRIAAASSSTTLTISEYANASHSFEATRGVKVWITFSAGGTVVKADRYSSAAKASIPGSVLATFPGAVVAATGPTSGSMVRFLGDSGPFDQHNIAWRGQVRFTPGTTTGHAIDYVPMEQYLRGVVPRESPSSWPVEALRAQAVAARSYAFDAAPSGSVLWCDTHSQVYNGADDGTSSHESAKTDSAVAATANQYVVYGSKVIKTFFSSSSGGRTANIQDVWLTSPPQPYYSSVDDADGLSSNPNYRWTLADMSGTTLAGKIRAYKLALAQPVPATIRSVKLDIGTSGFVRHVTLSWSKGSATVLTGTQFQSALRLKTSAFTVTLKNPPAPAVPRFQDTDARPLWTGSWLTIKTSAASGGSYRRASAAGAAVTVVFKGTSVSWIGTRLDHGGKADVSLDGARVATVDLYDSSTHYRSTVWTRTGLAADATHTLVIRTLGTHRTASHDSYVYVDAIDIAGVMYAVPRPPVWRRYEQTSSTVAYRGAWSSSVIAGLSGGTHKYSHDTSATAVFTFTGSRVRWIGKRAANYGKAWVSVDTSAPVLVDLYSATTRNQQRLFESGLLPAGRHTMTIRVTGTKNAKASYHYVDVDALEAFEPAK